MTTQNTESLPFMSSQERLKAYELIIAGCTHTYSKGKLNEDKARNMLNILVPLAKNDPFFFAHLTSYAFRKLKSKDLQVFLAYVSALSAADGLPFSPGSEFKKPNLRYISAAAIHQLDPKLACRVAALTGFKYDVPGFLNMARHSNHTLATALNKYMKYREVNLNAVEGIKKAGLGDFYKKLYRKMHRRPPTEVCEILNWPQKDRKIEKQAPLIDFKGFTDLEIAQKIQAEKLPVMGIISALASVQKKMSPVIAVALLEQATGNQAVILRETFDSAGVLKDPEVMKLYEDKIRTAKTALDRAETLSKTASAAVKEALEEARSDSRKEVTKGIGKIYMHIDDSGSMQAARNFAIDRGAIIAECVNDPEHNFAWGIFGSRGYPMPLPPKFTKDGFASVLFNYRDGGSTYAYALYEEARKFGADVDVFISDQEIDGGMSLQMKKFHEKNPEMQKPRACLVIDFGHMRRGGIQAAYEENGIPVSVMKPDQLKESALVAESIALAAKGAVGVVDEIMDTELLKLPSYYFTI